MTAGTGVSQRVREYIVNSFLLGEDDGLPDSASLLEHGVVDSIGMVELVLFIEETFEISLDEEELTNDNLDSIQRITALVEPKLGTRQADGALPARNPNDAVTAQRG